MVSLKKKKRNKQTNISPNISQQGYVHRKNKKTEKKKMKDN